MSTPATGSAPNKAVAAALTTVAGVLIQWLATGHLSIAQEGATALTGAVATLLVYAVSNYRRLLG